MATTQHNDCYGAMFPDTLHVSSNEPVYAKVFGYGLLSAGGMMRSDRHTWADLEQWDDCLQCPEFEDCYRFSLGKLALQAAIANK